MMTTIKTVSDVKKYAAMLVDEGTSFHPDTDFNEYINLQDRTPAYKKDEVKLRNKLMDECFDICEHEGEDIYEVMLDVYLKETGLDNVIGVEN